MFIKKRAPVRLTLREEVSGRGRLLATGGFSGPVRSGCARISRRWRVVGSFRFRGLSHDEKRVVYGGGGIMDVYCYHDQPYQNHNAEEDKRMKVEVTPHSHPGDADHVDDPGCQRKEKEYSSHKQPLFGRSCCVVRFDEAFDGEDGGENREDGDEPTGNGVIEFGDEGHGGRFFWGWCCTRDGLGDACILAYLTNKVKGIALKFRPWHT